MEYFTFLLAYQHQKTYRSNTHSRKKTTTQKPTQTHFSERTAQVNLRDGAYPRA